MCTMGGTGCLGGCDCVNGREVARDSSRRAWKPPEKRYGHLERSKPQLEVGEGDRSGSVVV